MNEELKALHFWKDSGRGKTMMDGTIGHYSEHPQAFDLMFLEGFRAAKAIYSDNAWHRVDLNPKDLPPYYKNVITIDSKGQATINSLEEGTHDNDGNDMPDYWVYNDVIKWKNF